MEGPYSARFPSSPGGETSRRAPVIRGAADERAHRLRHPRGGHRVVRVSSCTMTGQPDPDFAHRPVMADEIVDLFAPVPAGWLVDATLGGAGHATALLEAHPQLKVLGIDQDPDALAAAGARLERFGARARTRPGPLRSRWPPSSPPRSPSASPWSAPSSTSGSARRSSTGPTGASATASTPRSTCGWTRRRPQRRRGRQRLRRGRPGPGAARPTATSASPPASPRPIVAARPVRTTGELAELVRDAIPAPARRKGGHPAKRTFQAIRIEVNAELDVLPAALDAAIDALAPGGRIAVLSYHSGEDRIVKQRPARGRDRRLHLPARAALRLRRRARRSACCAAAAARRRPPSSSATPAPRAPACAPPRSSPPTRWTDEPPHRDRPRPTPRSRPAVTGCSVRSPPPCPTAPPDGPRPSAPRSRSSPRPPAAAAPGRSAPSPAACSSSRCS